MIKIKNYRLIWIILVFCLIYLLGIAAGNFILDYHTISPITIVLLVTFFLSLIIGCVIGNILTIRFIQPLKININTILYFLVIVAVFSSIIKIICFLKYYDSIGYIIQYANIIRRENIGESSSIAPTLINYLTSFNYIIFPLSLVLYKYYKKKSYIIINIITLLLILLISFTNFGRVGIIFCVFVFIAYLLVFRISFFKIKNILIIGVLYNIMNLPRLIRGGFDNFSTSLTKTSSYFLINIPPYFNSIVLVYIYYFSGIYAFNNFILEYDFSNTYGIRLFTPLINVVYRITGAGERIILIDENTSIPFLFNIYTILKDIVLDFGLIGLIILPTVVGLFIGRIWTRSSLWFDVLKIYSLVWVFFIPIYNIFSFGGYFIALITVILFSFIFNPFLKNEKIKS